MNVIRRLLWLFTFLVMILFFSMFIFIIPIEWIFTGKCVLINKYGETCEKILNYIKP